MTILSSQEGASSEWSMLNEVSYWKWPFWASQNGEAPRGQFSMEFLIENDDSEPSRRGKLRIVNFQSSFLLKMIIVSFQAGGSSEWSILNEVSYWKLVLWASKRGEAPNSQFSVDFLIGNEFSESPRGGKLRLDSFRWSFLLKMTIPVARVVSNPNLSC